MDGSGKCNETGGRVARDCELGVIMNPVLGVQVVLPAAGVAGDQGAPW